MARSAERREDLRRNRDGVARWRVAARGRGPARASEARSEAKPSEVEELIRGLGAGDLDAVLHRDDAGDGLGELDGSLAQLLLAHDTR